MVCCLQFVFSFFQKHYPHVTLSTLPNNSFVDWTKFKAFADKILNAAKIMISVFDGVENIVGKGENAGYQHFLLFLQCFQKVSFSGSLKVGMW